MVCAVACVCVCVVLLLCVMGPAVGEPSVVFGAVVVVVMGGCPCEGRVLVEKSCQSLQVSSFGLVRLPL